MRKLLTVFLALLVVIALSVPVLAATPTLTNLSVDPDSVEPGKNVAIKFTLGNTVPGGQVTYYIFDHLYEMVRQESIGGIPESREHHLVWDGKDQQGKALPPGEYTLEVVYDYPDMELQKKWDIAGAYGMAFDGKDFAITGWQKTNHFLKVYNSKFSPLLVQSWGGNSTVLFNPEGVAAYRVPEYEKNSIVYFVADTSNNRIRVFRKGASYTERILEWDIPLAGGVSSAPAGIAVDDDGLVYVVSRKTGWVYVYEVSGWTTDLNVKEVANWRTRGKFIIIGQPPAYPSGIAVDDEYVYIADNIHDSVTGEVTSMIRKFDKSGNFVLSWGQDDFGPRPDDKPLGGLTVADGRVYVADQNQDCIHVFDTGGNMYYTLPTVKERPVQVMVHPDGRIYVTFRSYDTIHRYVTTSGLLSETTSLTVLSSAGGTSPDPAPDPAPDPDLSPDPDPDIDPDVGEGPGETEAKTGWLTTPTGAALLGGLGVILVGGAAFLAWHLIKKRRRANLPETKDTGQ